MTVQVLTVTVIQERAVVNYEWQRLQVHEQQAERQKKNPMQKCLIFAQRAQQKSIEDHSKCYLLDSRFCFQSNTCH